MSVDPTHLAASISRSQEIEKSPKVSQRSSDVSQEQLAGESESSLHQIKPVGADQLRWARILKERERERREQQKHAHNSDSDSDSDSDDRPGLDVVV